MAIPQRFSAPAELRAENGFLIIIDRNASRNPGPGEHEVSVLTMDGTVRFSRPPSADLPDAKVVVLENATIAANGTLVVAAQAWSREGAAAAVLIVYDVATQRTLRIIRTNPVVCFNVAFDSDGDVWCVGPDAEADRAKRSDYSLLWRYAIDGRLLARTLTRSEFGPVNPWSRFTTMTLEGSSLHLWLPQVSAFVDVTSKNALVQHVPAAPASVPRELTHMIKLPGRKPIALTVVRGTDADRDSLHRGFFQFDATSRTWERLIDWPELPIGFWPIGVDDSGVLLWDRYQRQVVRLASK